MSPKITGESPVELSVAGVADRLVRHEMIEAGVKRPDAERAVARRAGIAASALDELRRGRVKYVERIEGRIHAVWVQFLERQIAGLENELAIARADRRAVDLGAAETAILAAKAALGKD